MYEEENIGSLYIIHFILFYYNFYT